MVTTAVSKMQIVWIVLAILALRLAIGFHFFMEGTSKVRSTTAFTAAPFLKGARGPLAPYFQGMLDDPDGRILLCIAETSPGERAIIDPELTFALWEDFADRAYEHYSFADPKLIAEVEQRITDAQAKLAAKTSSEMTATERKFLNDGLARDRESVWRIKQQLTALNNLVKQHRDELTDWLDFNRSDLVAHFSAIDRERGFARDGEARTGVFFQVDGLRSQTDTIVGDRYRQRQAWSSQVRAIWDSLELGVSQLAVDRQSQIAPLKIHRPYDQPGSKLKLVNRVIPWFDLTVGTLLLLGLFTRLAAFAGGTFLASVIATQPPWVSGSKPVFYESIEMFALFLLVAVAAGRFGGLDYFLQRRNSLKRSLVASCDSRARPSEKNGIGTKDSI